MITYAEIVIADNNLLTTILLFSCLQQWHAQWHLRYSYGYRLGLHIMMAFTPFIHTLPHAIGEVTANCEVSCYLVCGW